MLYNVRQMGDNLKDLKNNFPNFNFENLAKIANVEVRLTAQLGKTRVPLKEILRYEEGSLIPLDNSQGEPVDIFVDSILVARGLIVAVDNCYGVKVTQIIKD